MKRNRSDYFIVNPEINKAIINHEAIVALELAVITHGLPYPENINLAYDVEKIIQTEFSIPATIGVIKGNIVVGITPNQIEFLGSNTDNHKIGSRDFSAAATFFWSGGTTVSATVVAANIAGIKVFVTGGIGGVHRDAPFDISSDLLELSRTPVLVICAGVKSILDIQATVEYLETLCIPVIGFDTDEFPAFYSRESGIKTPISTNRLNDIIEMAKIHWELGNKSAVLVVNPIPQEYAIPAIEINQMIKVALESAKILKITGKDVTPFLLNKVNEMTRGGSLEANLALLRSNAQVAARIANMIVRS